MKLGYLSFLLIPFCVSEDINLTENKGSLGAGRDVPLHAQNSPHKEVIDRAILEETSRGSHYLLACVLQEGEYLVCVFGDCMGRIYYKAKCYRLVDKGKFQKMGTILYSNRADFDAPKIEGDHLVIKSKGSESLIYFDMKNNALYNEDIDNEIDGVDEDC